MSQSLNCRGKKYIRNSRCEDASLVTKIPLPFRKQKWLVTRKTCALPVDKGKRQGNCKWWENIPRKDSKLENSWPR